MNNPLPPGATGTDQTFAPTLLGTFRDGFIQRVNDYLAGGDAELREAAAAIAGDVIDELVPA